jgi:threonyl-tRNA synthetase
VKNEIYAKKVLDLLENNEIRPSLTTKRTIVRKLEMLKCKTFMLIVGEKKKNGTIIYPSWTGRKGNISVTIEEFAE